VEIPVPDHRRIGVASNSRAAFGSSSAAVRRSIAHHARSASLQRGGYRQSPAPEARLNKFRSVSLAIAGAGVLIFCLASIALSITGIVGRVPGSSSGAGGAAPAAVHAAPGIDHQAAVPDVLASGKYPADRDVQHDPLVNR
jgi:hypothetical protein